jgi:hypothetical protein
VRQAAAGEESPTIEFLWDLRKCYEHVQHKLVLQEAKAQGYPTTLLRVSLSSYRWARLIGMGTIVGRGVIADRGIIAGSSHATFEIAMLIQRQLAAVALANQVLASIHIDDLSVTIARPTKVATAQATRDVASECKTMFAGMGLPLAEDKAQWIASSAAMHDVARRMLGSSLGKGLHSARRLGLDHSLRQQSVKGGRAVRRQREAVFLVRRKLLKRLGNPGKLAQTKVIRAGLTPAVLYGAECRTPSRAIITQLRAATLSTMGVRAPGVPYDLAALALPTGADPALKAYEAPLVRWHRELWLLEQPHPAHPDALTAAELAKAWYNTSKAMGDGLGWALDNPVAGAIRAARLVGWDLDQPGRLTDGVGEIKLSERSPASLQATYRRQWEEHLPQQWLRSKLQQAPASPERDALLDAGVDLQPLMKVLRATGKSALKPPEKRKVLQFFAGTLKHHFQSDPSLPCQLCGGPDSLQHRLADCKTVQDWMEEHPRVAKAIKADPIGSLAATKGWRPKPPPHRDPTKCRSRSRLWTPCSTRTAPSMLTVPASRARTGMRQPRVRRLSNTGRPRNTTTAAPRSLRLQPG